jgi:hypothetical protein
MRDSHRLGFQDHNKQWFVVSVHECFIDSLFAGVPT